MRHYNSSWVIEAYTDTNPHLGMYMQDRKRGKFTIDINKACRFMSEQEAQHTIDAYRTMIYRRYPMYNFRMVNVSLLGLKANTKFCTMLAEQRKIKERSKNIFVRALQFVFGRKK